MSTLQDLWINYWWVLPVALMVLCMIGCILGGRRRGLGCCPCSGGTRWGRRREPRSS
ncbi:MAG: hypothetical protein ACYTGV_02970 [Planctomycetota bacterium]|jgi:hypothetical protein